MMIEEIRKYFLEHVSLANEFNNILADFLEDDNISYTIEPIPTEPIITKYTDGSSLRQLTFQFGSRESYDNSVAQNINNLDFYEKFQNQIEDNNLKRILPNIKGIQSIECLNNGTIQDIQNGTAKYVIEMRITYLKEV